MKTIEYTREIVPAGWEAQHLGIRERFVHTVVVDCSEVDADLGYRTSGGHAYLKVPRALPPGYYENTLRPLQMFHPEKWSNRQNEMGTHKITWAFRIRLAKDEGMLLLPIERGHEDTLYEMGQDDFTLSDFSVGPAHIPLG